MAKWLENSWTPKKVILVTLRFSNQERQLSAAKISAKQTAAPQQEFETIAELVKKMGKETAYVLHVEGAGVLNRLVENIPNYKEQLIVNGDKEDFYFTSLPVGNKLLTSFFRKTLIAETMQELQLLKVFVVNVTSGIPPLAGLGERNLKLHHEYILEITGGEVKRFERSEQNPSDGRKENKQVHVDGQLMEYAEAQAKGILQQVVNPETKVVGGFEAEEKEEKQTAYKEYSKFRLLGLSLVFGILLMLIANYFYTNSLNQQVADLEMELALNNENLTIIDRMEQEKIRKGQLLQSSGINSSSFVSYYLNEIGKSVPKTISLFTLNEFPLTQRLKQKQKVEIAQEIIEITGETPSSPVLDDWMEYLNRYEWVNRVELLNYSKTASGKSQFHIQIKIKK